MAVKIRLARRGRKKMAIYDVVVANVTAPRDGRFIEKIGVYNPTSNPAHIDLNDEKAFEWIMKGAQPTDTVKAMLSYRGILLKKHLQIGVLKGAITQEQADAKFEEWKNNKESKISGKVDSLAKQKQDKAQERLQAEAKVKEARAEAIRKKQTPAPEEATAEAEVSEEAEEAVAPAEETQNAAPVAEATPEAPATEEKEEVAEEKAPEPVAEEKAVEPVAEEKAAEPVAEEKAAEPVAEAKAEPAKEEEDKKEAPATEDKKEEDK